MSLSCVDSKLLSTISFAIDDDPFEGMLTYFDGQHRVGRAGALSPGSMFYIIIQSIQDILLLDLM